MELLRLLLGAAASRVRKGEPLVPHPAELAPALLVKKALERLDDLLGVEKAPLVTYPEAIRYFVTDRPDDARVAGGAIIRRPDISGSLLIWLFLDTDSEPLRDADGKLYGRKLIVVELDDELLECLGDSGILVVR